jgi:tRNA(fMet)-specific endonuclease VapC
MRYLLDTNIVSDLVRNPGGRVAQHVREVGEEQVYTSVIVAAELRYGAAKKDSPRLSAQLEVVLRALEVLPLEPPVDSVYGQIRANLERAGKMIGGNDLLISSHAISLGDVLVTANEREFSQIADLAVENWLKPGG